MAAVRTLKHQLQMLMTLAVGLSILIMGIIWMTYNRLTLEQQAERVSAIQAEMIGSAIRPALMFGDDKLARELVGQLKISPDIVSILIVTTDGETLAAFPPEAGQDLARSFHRMGADESVFDGQRLKMVKPIHYRESEVGKIYIEYDLSEIKSRQFTDTVNIILIMAGTLLFAFVIAMRLQRKLTDSERRLREASEDADRANRAKSDFLSTVSHELRTPIHGIIGLQRLIANESDNLTDDQRENLLLAQQSAKSLQALVNDILDMAKIESGHFDVKQLPFDLQRCVCDAFVPFRPMAKEKNISLSLHIEQTPKMIVSDESLLRQILLNLISNALKFTDHGEVSIHVTETREMLEFSVCDTGSGIDADNLTRVFDPFVQLPDQGEAVTQKGTGLGTSIAKRYVELLGGGIQVHSQPGKGSCFTFTIPCKSEGSEICNYIVISDIYKPVSHDTPDTESVQRSGFRVLLAEDDPIGQRIANRQLARAGMEVTIVDNGNEAWREFNSHPYDLLITDVRMPGIDGIELTKKIRRLEQESSRPRIKIIGLSAHALEEIATQCVDAGMDRFMAKPIDPAAIITAIDEIDSHLGQTK